MADETTAVVPAKAGYKTTEFWLSLAAMILGALFASGAISSGGTTDKIAGLVATILGSLGYTVSRTLVKK